MKKGIKKILAIAMTLTLLLTVGAVWPKSSSIALDTYLRTPTHIAALNEGERDVLLIYDASDSHLKAYALNEAKTSSTPFAFSPAINLVDITSKADEVYAIVSESGKKHISKIEIEGDDSKISLTTLNAGVSFDFFEVTKIAIDGDRLYVLYRDNIIQCFTIGETTLTHLKTILISELTFPEDVMTISNIEAMNNRLLIVCEDTLFEVDTNGSSPYALDEILSIEDESIDEIVCSDTHIFITCENTITKINPSDKTTSSLLIDKTKYTVNKTAVLGDFLYTTSTEIHKVFGIELSNDRVFTAISNAEVTPTLYKPENVIVGKTNSQTLLQILPYTQVDALTLPKDTHIAVIASDTTFSNHYYCMVTRGRTNSYGFIEKSSITIIEKSKSNEKVMTFASETRVMRYPSQTIDSINTVIEKLPSNTKLERLFFLGKDDEMFTSGTQNTFSEVVLEDGRHGYVENSRLTIRVTAKTRSLECNAKLKIDSDLMAYEGETDILMTISAGTRVKIDGKLDRTKPYTKVTFNLTSGEVVTGYVLTANISADALTLLQILGIVLVGINLIFIAVIFIIRKKLTNT